jgi:hypothetical protein
MTDDTIAAGREAWLKLGTANSFENWKTVSRAIVVGRQQAMRAANINKPQGKRYGVAINAWLEQNGFRGMPYPTRTACCRLIDHLPEIELWRAATPGAEAWHHPQVIIRRWRHDFAPDRRTEPRKSAVTSPAPKRQQIVERVAEVALARRQGKPIFWPQDFMRRAHEAMLSSRSTDLLTLARLALQAAIRSEDDLLALIDDPPRRLPCDDKTHAAHQAA